MPWSLLTGGQLDSSGPAEHLEFDSVRKKTSVGEGSVPLAGPRVTGLLVCQELLQRESLVWFGIHLTESKENRQVESPLEARLGGRTKAPAPSPVTSSGTLQAVV